MGKEGDDRREVGEKSDYKQRPRQSLALEEEGWGERNLKENTAHSKSERGSYVYTIVSDEA